MKTSTFGRILIPAVTATLFSAFTATGALAYSGFDLNRLLTTNICPSCDLVGAPLSGAYLSSANLAGANLSNATLTNASLAGATLTGATLVTANLSGANLTSANLTNGILGGANLTFATLTNATLKGAVLTSATLSNALWIDGVYRCSILSIGSCDGRTTYSPEIAVSGNGATITDGDATPAVTDYTDFGGVAVSGGSLTRTFTIGNSGDWTLNLTGTPRVSVSGADAADFTVSAQPDSTALAVGGNTTFQVTFAPAGLGTRTAALSIANDDSNENPYNFAIQGSGMDSAPTAITLDNAVVVENAAVDTLVGTLATVDPDAGETFTYSLASSPGCAGADNESFTIVGSQLRTGAVLDFEVQNAYAICVRSTDSGGLSYDKEFTISVTDLCTLADGTVIDPGDSGVGTLRGMLDEVCPGGTIDFAPGVHAITLSSDVLHIRKDVTLAGPGAANLTINGGGAVQLFQVPGPTSFILKDLTLANGAAAGGGALLDNEQATTTISGCLFSNNTAMMGGGAILAAGAMIIRDSAFTGNSSPFLGYGGAIYGVGGTMTISNSLFNGNSGAAGGAISNTTSAMTLTSVTMTGNSATSYGGAIYTGGPLDLVNATVACNSAGQGGGIAVGAGTVTLRNSIVATNTAAGGGPDILGAVTSQGYNLFGSTGEATIAGDPTGNLVGQDPLLEPLADNGGPTRTMALAAGSPAIDPAAANGATWLDQRGYLRSGSADLGAYEYQGRLPVATAATALELTGFTANWAAVDGAGDYRLEVATDSGFTTLVVGFADLVTGNVTTYPVTGLSAATPYSYRVRAMNGSETSAASNVVTVATLTGQATAVVVDPDSSLKLYAAFDGAGVQRSSDGGVTWLPAATAPAIPRVLGLAVDPTDHATLFAATYGGGVSRSSDGGDHWATCANAGLSGPGLNVLALANDPAGRLYAATEAGVFRSLAVGDCAAWEAAATLPASAGVLTIAATDPPKMYAGIDGSGVYFSTTGGDAWSAAVVPAINQRIKALVINPADPTKLFAATYGNGVYLSINGGGKWLVCANSNLANLKVTSLSIDGAGKIYAGTEAGVFVSSDGCATWAELNSGLPN